MHSSEVDVPALFGHLRTIYSPAWQSAIDSGIHYLSSCTKHIHILFNAVSSQLATFTLDA